MDNSVLLLEDSKVVNEYISNELKTMGYDVDSSFSLVDAKEKLSKNNYSLFVVDLVLPDGESDTLIEKLCKENSLKVIVLTSSRDKNRRKKLFGYGIIDYFIKDQTLAKVPYEIDVLIKKLQSTKDSKILFIDDSKTIHTTISYLFEPRDYQVDHAFNGTDGLNMIINSSYDLILLDLNLGDFNGDEVLELVKKNNKFALTPVIILSSTDDEDTILKLYKLGACDFIKKPFIIEEFLLKIDTWIDYHKRNKNYIDANKILEDYKQAVDKSSIVSKTDPKGYITYVNDKFCKISGYTNDELIGKSHNIVRHRDNDPLLFKELWDTIKNKKIYQKVLKNRAKDGSDYYVDTTITPIIDSSDEIIEYISIRNEVKL